MGSGLADFIEGHAETIIDDAITFARSVEVGTPLDDVALRDHLPDIVEAIVADLRRPQTRAEEIEKSHGRAVSAVGSTRSAAGTHALHRAHSGYSISHPGLRIPRPARVGAAAVGGCAGPCCLGR
ncbi:RsbRD N-terminal domain-containing protein [Agrilutibacter solisilvae]|uniref:RsbRD N-terminal domain-containing protein n=1 Tax=Agrilutibacter solisilvae TaxID=2763317 RepID=A0A974XYC5_9GAMM|nr:RsbRD N-terminal domain-containing protein [Lysobacter solisilvae]QSX78056.1 RsbRD N-terminal domain-containing protein [Lysobacter solisilvae]